MGYAERFAVQFTIDAGVQNFTFRGAVGWLRFTGEQQREIFVYNGYGVSTPVATLQPYEQRDVEINGFTDQLTIGWDADPGYGWDEATFTFLASGEPVDSSGGAASQVLLAQSNGKPTLWGGAGNSFLSIDNVAAVMPFYRNAATGALTPWQGFEIERDTFSAVYRKTTRPYSTGIAFAAAGRQLFGSIWSLISLSRIIRILQVDVNFQESTAAVEAWIELSRITTVPTGGSGITPATHHNGSSTAELRRLPTAGGAEGELISSATWKGGITGAAPTTMPTPPVLWQNLYTAQWNNEAPLYASPGSGFGIFVDVDAAATIRMSARIKYIEEAV